VKREIKMTPECHAFIAEQPQRVLDKFYEVIAVLIEIQVVGAPYVKKSTKDYRKAVSRGNELLKIYLGNE
jgi:hypothetical protein